ncbi:MAG TPA: hypothetical protein DDY37_05945, partial [Legionella sp.]|nr:hypothetical protein [Legionella sp.]
MTTKAKPYRLISDAELGVLQMAFEVSLAAWNDAHALFPLKCTLHRSGVIEKPTVFTWIADEKGPIALLTNDYYATLKHALFDDES